MDGLLQDLRYGARRLLRTPAFSALVILTLALGMGANTAIFSVVNALLLRPLPYAQPEQLVNVAHYYGGANPFEASVSARGFVTYVDRAKSFSSLAAETRWGVNLSGAGGDPERLAGARVSPSWFSTYAAQPARGRTFTPDEDQPGHNHVVVISDDLWRRRFGADPSIVGRDITLNGEAWTVVGIMPHGFHSFFNSTTEIWSPLTFTPQQLAASWGNEFMTVTGRLKPGVPPEAAQRELTALATAIRRENPDQFSPTSHWTLIETPLSVKNTAQIRTPLLILSGSVGFVLLIACANVANLLLARAAGRMKEISVRMALGAKRRQVLRQLLTESILLGAIGGALGILIAWLGVRGIVALAPARLHLERATIDGSVALFTLVVSLAAGVVFGIAPALQATRTNMNDTLREGGRGAIADRSGQLLRRSIVVAELALALTLLAGAGLFIRSFSRLSATDTGFNPDNLLTFSIALPTIRYADATAQLQAFDRIADAISHVPGVKGVALSSGMPFTNSSSTSSFSVEGFAPPTQDDFPWGDIRVVNEDYARTMGMKLLKGRFFTSHDDANSAGVVVVDDVLASKYWPDTDPVGKRITYDDPGPDAKWLTVIGVVPHATLSTLDGDRRTQVYVSVRQQTQPNYTFAVRTTGDPFAVVNDVRRAVQSVDHDLPLATVQSMEALMADSLGQRRLSTVLLGLFASLALLLSAIGIYGVISHSVAQRRQEFGVRMALGAQRRDVLALVLGQGARLAGTGLVLGLVGAYGLTQLIQSQLYQVDARDPASFGSGALLLVFIAMFATVLPALRATRVNPTQALRQE